MDDDSCTLMIVNGGGEPSGGVSIIEDTEFSFIFGLPLFFSYDLELNF